MDAIELDGSLWLVPEWLDFPDEKMIMPARMVCLATIPHERVDAAYHHIVVSGPVPKSVLDGQAPPELESQYLVIERPDIRLSRPSVH